MKLDNLKVLLDSGFLIALGLYIPAFLIFGGGEIFNPIYYTQFDIMFTLFLTGIITTLVSFTAYKLILKNNKYGDSIGYSTNGEKPSYPYWKKWGSFQLFLASLILFGAIFLTVQNVGLGGKFTTDSRILPIQQFTKGQSLLFSIAQIPVSENLIVLGSILLLSFLLLYLAIKYKIKTEDYKYYLYALFIFGFSLGAFVLHQTVYSGSETALTSVLLFWALGGFITIFTGSFFPFLAMHIANNFMVSYSLIYSSDSGLSTTIRILIGLTVLYFILYYNKHFGSKKTTSPVIS